MNPNALMKQVQNLQKEMLKEQDKINNTIFEGESSLVKVKINGKKELTEIKIENEGTLDADDIDALEDMIIIAVNNAMKKVDQETEKKMGKYTNGIPGLF